MGCNNDVGWNKKNFCEGFFGKLKLNVEKLEKID
jgi:hypothetical protein